MLALLLALTLTFESQTGCELEQAQLAFVPPASVHILATERCGGVTCWVRWVDFEGKKLGESRACETDSNSGGGVLRSIKDGGS